MLPSAHDSARYLSNISVREMRTKALAQAAAQVAYDIAHEEIADLNPGYDAPTIDVYCAPNAPSKECNGIGQNPLPETVMVTVEMNMFDNIFGAVSTGFYGWRISASVEMRYVGH
jgi:hypothetical protein